MYAVRHVTPPSATYAYHPENAYGSATSGGSSYSHDSSPESVLTHITTPPRSPIRQHGPMLLPKVRTQDQVTEPTVGPVRSHRRAVSAAASNSYSNNWNPYPTQRPPAVRGITSPPDYSSLVSPVSAASSPADAAFSSALNSPITFAPHTRRSGHARSTSSSGIKRGHARSGSASSIDESSLSRYGYPTYRNMPAYVTTSMNTPSTMPTAMPTTYSHVQQLSHVSHSSYTSQVSTVSHSSRYSPEPQLPLPAELVYDSFDELPATTSLLDYLTALNPSPALVRRITCTGRGMTNYFWWDVRNLRSWTDFSIRTISNVPGLLPLLQVPVPCPALPTPARPSLQPDNETALHDIIASYHTTKVNAALKVAQGNTHMKMRAIKSLPSGRAQPEFIASYKSDFEKTIFGEQRGRVVGLVKAYDQWNSGMRSEAPNKQVYYLQGLAHLHHVMREHGCRYGFIITEIEILCVRCGGPHGAAQTDPTIVNVNADSSVPLFGYLELAPPIRISTHGLASDGSLQMTAGLALWYLHMLAKENPLPGMGSWRMEVGGPAALSRQNILDRDSWIPKPNLSEKREAKRVRGWVWPEEPLSRKECGRGRRKSIR